MEAFSKINKNGWTIKGREADSFLHRAFIIPGPRRPSHQLAQPSFCRWGNTPKEMTFNSTFYSEFVAVRTRKGISFPQTVVVKLQRSDAKSGLSALWFCYTAKNTHWLLIVWVTPWDSFDVLVYLWAVLSDGEKLQNVESFCWTLCSWGIKRWCSGYVISESDANFFSNVEESWV